MLNKITLYIIYNIKYIYYIQYNRDDNIEVKYKIRAVINEADTGS